jgi:hypothetical protein
MWHTSKYLRTIVTNLNYNPEEIKEQIKYVECFIPFSLEFVLNIKICVSVILPVLLSGCDGR